MSLPVAHRVSGTRRVVEWVGWLVLLLTIPVLASIVGSVLTSSVPTFKSVGVVMHIDPKTGKRTLHPAPIDHRCEMGEAALPLLLVFPLLHAGNALLAIFGPFHAVRAKLGRRRALIAAVLSLPVTGACCAVARWSITYINL